jgi:hypothetical protein
MPRSKHSRQLQQSDMTYAISLYLQLLEITVIRWFESDSQLCLKLSHEVHFYCKEDLTYDFVRVQNRIKQYRQLLVNRYLISAIFTLYSH